MNVLCRPSWINQSSQNQLRSLDEHLLYIFWPINFTDVPLTGVPCAAPATLVIIIDLCVLHRANVQQYPWLLVRMQRSHSLNLELSLQSSQSQVFGLSFSSNVLLSSMVTRGIARLGRIGRASSKCQQLEPHVLVHKPRMLTHVEQNSTHHAHTYNYTI